MIRVHWQVRFARILLCCLGIVISAQAYDRVRAQSTTAPIQPKQLVTDPTPVPIKPPSMAPGDNAYPVNLPTALQLANARPIDIAVASERIRAAAAQLERAQVLWLPTIYLGTDYYRHDGRIQETPGNVFNTSRSSFLAGAGPYAVFALTDALFEPLAARQVVRARQADLQATTNDSFLAVAEAYFNVQQARGELAGAEDALRRAEDLVAIAEKLSKPPVEIIPSVEVARIRAERARRRQAVQTARERWRAASADLVRLLRLDAPLVIEPIEPPHLRVTLVEAGQTVDQLIPIALTSRPELASRQALVQATLQRLREERLRPLVPSVLLRGASSGIFGTLAGGVYGGGRNESLSNFGARGDFDVQILWEFQNLGFGNQARIRERRAEHQLSVLEFFRVQDQVAAEVAQAHAQSESAEARVKDAEDGLKDAVESVVKNFEGIRQPKIGATLFIRPQEVVAALQALAQAYSDYSGAVGDYNRGQFRLYRALGQPAQMACPATHCQSK